jgi:nitroimidazol reductase NimA-like FMN-containing flavoprotein (pyridoxamine 5'-phosphate oxidase superfamily)
VLTWADFKAAAPELAAEGERLLNRGGIGQALHATVRGDEPPRIHPIYFAIADERLYAFILRSPKLRDLEEDGRFALHTHQDPAAPSEFSLRGRAQLVRDEAIRSAVAAGRSFEVDETYGLVEFRIESALLGSRSSAEEWPPRYSSWAAPTAT